MSHLDGMDGVGPLHSQLWRRPDHPETRMRSAEVRWRAWMRGGSHKRGRVQHTDLSFVGTLDGVDGVQRDMWRGQLDQDTKVLVSGGQRRRWPVCWG